MWRRCLLSNTHFGDPFTRSAPCPLAQNAGVDQSWDMAPRGPAAGRGALLLALLLVALATTRAAPNAPIDAQFGQVGPGGEEFGV